MDKNRDHSAQRFDQFLASVALTLLGLLAVSCKEDDDDDIDVSATLDTLGVQSETTPRMKNNEEALPESYSPLGASYAHKPKMELFIGGVCGPEGGIATLYQDLTDLYLAPPTDRTPIQPDILHSIPQEESPWMKGNGVDREELRASINADIDGDGFEEIVTLFSRNGSMRLHVLDCVDGLFETEEISLLFDVSGLLDVAIEGGDFNGDGTDDLAIAYSQQARTVLTFVQKDETNVYRVQSGIEKTFHPVVDGPILLTLRSGNIDLDGEEELVVIANEKPDAYLEHGLHTRYFIYDDARSGFGELESGPVEGAVPETGFFTANGADVALGDIDGDHIDEILIAGRVNESILLLALDDRDQSFASLGVSMRTSLRKGLELNTLDIDGDRLAEIQVNEFVHEDWTRGAPWSLAYELVGFRHHAVQTVKTGDLTGDGRDDIVWDEVGRTDGGSRRLVSIFAWSRMDEEQKDPNIEVQPVHAGGVIWHEDGGESCDGDDWILLPVNCDADSPVLHYSKADKRLVFTEPIVIAALAAPPCGKGIGQNTDACVTSFGNTDSTTHETERSLTVTAKNTAGYGFEEDFTDSGFEIEGEISRAVSSIRSEAYSLEETVIFTTGPNEDTVVFTTIPLDQYTYSILSHPDPNLIGQKIVVSLARDPITLQVSREFYNEHAIEGSPRIDDAIFSHEIGRLDSYPTPAVRNALLAGSANKRGLQTSPVSVGQGEGGVTTKELKIGEEHGQGGALEMGFEFSWKTTVTGVSYGGSLGVSSSSTMTITSGKETTYTGNVGTIDEKHFSDNKYSWGLFTYIHEDSSTGQQFEVINYWVE